jgi:hypothetical protein
MTHIANFHDAASVTAHAAIEDRLHMAAREALIAEARGEHHRHASLHAIGHLLVRFGMWLQAITAQPTIIEETVQW